ncbi:hypothetical protein M378DRAFT_316539 [Amanita muscaria Koide BX008]|uniref:Uncharacterized protein n=1 Tax=Amanita muscaria (strain Koide BX008) TaxID=946122 RepID=A0A0C2WQ95_AMAMK|nr:hypothetical protein M378DRAFT_316539 [Amanita muscaria Koide BX008]
MALSSLATTVQGVHHSSTSGNARIVNICHQRDGSVSSDCSAADSRLARELPNWTLTRNQSVTGGHYQRESSRLQIKHGFWNKRMEGCHDGHCHLPGYRCHRKEGRRRRRLHQGKKFQFQNEYWLLGFSNSWALPGRESFARADIVQVILDLKTNGGKANQTHSTESQGSDGTDGPYCFTQIAQTLYAAFLLA